MSPDMVSEVKVLTSNYAPEYGSSTSGQIMAVTRSGGSAFHGAGFTYNRSDAMTATQWGASEKPEYNRKNFGTNIGGPAKLPFLWGDKVKSFFFFNYEGFRQEGGSNAPTVSIPSIRQRNGDFTDWRDSSGNLIPIYDPATIRPDGRGGYLKDQFMGCNGNQPNVICPSRISPIVRAGWTRCRRRPTTARSTTISGPPIPDSILGNSNYFLGRYDLQIGSSDHMFASFWHQRAPAKFDSVLPQPIANESYSDPQNSWVNRFNWDRTFSSTLLNHMSMGYLNRNEGYGSVNQDFVDDFPQISGRGGLQRAAADDVQRRLRAVRPDRGRQHRQHHHSPHVHHQRHGDVDAEGAHAEVRDGIPQDHGEPPREQQSGGDVQLLARSDRPRRRQQRQPDRQLPARRRRQRQLDVPRRGFHRIRGRTRGSSTPATRGASAASSRSTTACDGTTTRPRRRSTTNSRSSIPWARTPGAGGRPGRLAFAGDCYGSASYGARYPEEDWYGGFAPGWAPSIQPQRQDGRPKRLGHLLHPGVLSRMGRRHLAGRLLEHADVLEHPRRHSAGVLPRSGLPAELQAPPDIRDRLSERAGHPLPSD